MLGHILSVLLLGLFIEEIYRTIRNFGIPRDGVAGTAASKPIAHIILAIVFLGFSVSMVFGDWAPIYAGPIASVVSVVYLGASIRFRRQKGQDSVGDN